MRTLTIAEVLRIVRAVTGKTVYHVDIIEWPDCTEYRSTLIYRAWDNRYLQEKTNMNNDLVYFRLSRPGLRTAVFKFRVCGICNGVHLAERHCPYCGAFKIVLKNVVRGYVNQSFIALVRAHGQKINDRLAPKVKPVAHPVVEKLRARLVGHVFSA